MSEDLEKLHRDAEVAVLNAKLAGYDVDATCDWRRTRALFRPAAQCIEPARWSVRCRACNVCQLLCLAHFGVVRAQFDAVLFFGKFVRCQRCDNQCTKFTDGWDVEPIGSAS